jgi:hypothetical protein
MRTYKANIAIGPAGYNQLKKYRWVLMILISISFCVTGCRTADEPRMRFGAFFGSPAGMKFPEPENLGEHRYDFALNETLGMVYTCKGGFIDIGHVREAADRTAYFRKITSEAIDTGQTKYSFSVIEPSRYWVTLTYPENWDSLSEEERAKISSEVSIVLGQYLGHTSLIWHEILGWYGFASFAIFSDKISAFSWEDPYSDLLGTHLAMLAMREGNNYDESITKLINQTLEELEVQSADVARQAAQSIKGHWYTGGFYFFVTMKGRNLDIGLDDGYVTPWLVPDICPEAKPELYPVPDLSLVTDYGFKVDLEIELNVREQGKICNSIGLNTNSRIKPAVHFAQIIKYIDTNGKHQGIAKLDY